MPNLRSQYQLPKGSTSNRVRNALLGEAGLRCTTQLLVRSGGIVGGGRISLALLHEAGLRSASQFLVRRFVSAGRVARRSWLLRVGGTGGCANQQRDDKALHGFPP